MEPAGTAASARDGWDVAEAGDAFDPPVRQIKKDEGQMMES